MQSATKQWECVLHEGTFPLPDVHEIIAFGFNRFVRQLKRAWWSQSRGIGRRPEEFDLDAWFLSTEAKSYGRRRL